MSLKSFKELVKRTLGFLQLSQEVAAVNVDLGPASAGKLLVRLEPSDRLLRVFSAITAGDFNLLTVEHNTLLNEQKNTQAPAGLKQRPQVTLLALLILAGVWVFVNFFMVAE